jgi:C_GCAxxG_C_C family probable redox protein
MDVSVKALENFDSGYNCAESVLLAINKDLNISEGRSLPRIATGFGGGIARNGSLCGALTGGIMAIGLTLGRDDNQGSRDPCYPAVDRLFNGFLEKFGSTQCRDLIGVDLKTSEGQKAHANRDLKDTCRSCVKWSARISLDLITEFSRGASANA